MSEKVMIPYNGVMIQAERMNFIPVEPVSAIEIFIPDDNKMAIIRHTIENVYKIPVQSATGEPFSYHIQYKFGIEIVAK